jgi:hypothetical protein
MKKNFTAPCWLMLLPAILVGYDFYRINRLGALWLVMHHRNMVLPCICLALVIIDAVVYWSIRNTNIYRRDSWMHILLFAFALSTPYLRDWIFEGYDDGFTFGADIVRFVRVVSMAQFFAFWISLILGHALFIRLLLRSSTRKPDGSGEESDPRNLLDDVLD